MCVCQRVKRGRRQKEEVGEKRRRLGGRKEGQDRYKERAFLFRWGGCDCSNTADSDRVMMA